MSNADTDGPDLDDDATSDLGVARILMMPCLTCYATTTFTAHSLDRDAAVVVYRCETCNRRIMVEL